MTIVFSTVLLVAQMHATVAFHVPSGALQNRPIALQQTPFQAVLHHRSSSRTARCSSPTILHGLFDDDYDDGSQSPIPPELRDEIYQAEANAPAAQGRTQRIAVYVLLTIVGVTIAFFNAFLTDLRFGEGSPSTDLSYYGFGWVQDNFLWTFLFMSKIGGGIGLLGAGLSGTLAEVEVRSKKENAEKIWAEMQRRKTEKENPSKSNKKKKKRALSQSSKKDMTGKQRKRMSALEELMVDEPEPVVVQQSEKADEATEATEKAEAESKEGGEDDGIFGKIQGFYKKADSMAASQALLLNKELEDRGVIDKITDESGLKVVGKEAAKKQGDNGNDEKL
ncbi:hypothetical protein ACHAXR_010398 [Thalassiosira sp. AJA248-18]